MIREFLYERLQSDTTFSKRKSSLNVRYRKCYAIKVLVEHSYLSSFCKERRVFLGRRFCQFGCCSASLWRATAGCSNSGWVQAKWSAITFFGDSATMIAFFVKVFRNGACSISPGKEHSHGLLRLSRIPLLVGLFPPNHRFSAAGTVLLIVVWANYWDISTLQQNQFLQTSIVVYLCSSTSSAWRFPWVL